MSIERQRSDEWKGSSPHDSSLITHHSLLILILLLAWLPETWGREGEDKSPLMLPEVVILGQDVSVLKAAKERLVPQELTQAMKVIPSEAREKIDLSALEPAGKTAPAVSSPGCLFGNAFTGSIARAFLGDEAAYKVGLYRYQTGDYAGALEAFTRLRVDYPQSSYRGSARYWEGESHFQLDQVDNALVAYQQVIQDFPKERLREYALYAAADIYLRQQQPDKAVPLLRELATQYPASPLATPGRSALGAALFHTAHYAEAAAVYSQLLTSPNGETYRPHALFWRAESFFQQGAFEAAAQGYGEFLQAYPRGMRAEEALYGLGWAELSTRRYRAALETFERMQQTFPKTRLLESMLYARVRAHVALQQMQPAQEIYRQMAQAFPTGKWVEAAAIAFLGAAYDAGDYRTAAALSQQFIERHPQGPGVPIALVIQADVLYHEGRFAEAIAAYRKAERQGLGEDLLQTILLKRALAAYQLQDFATAVAELERLRRTFPTSRYAAEAAFWLGESRFYNRQFREALQAYEQVPPGNPRYPGALYGKGWVSYQGSDWLKAAAEFEQIVRQHPEASIRPEVLYRLGEVQHNLKNFEAALSVYQQLLREYPQDQLVPNARFRIGWVKYKTGSTAQAILDLSEVVRQYPAHPITAEARYWLGLAYMSEEQFGRARAEFEAVLALRPPVQLSSQTLLRLGDTFYNQGGFEQAIDVYSRLVNRASPNLHTPDAEYGIILALYQLRRLTEYYTRAKAFIERYPTNPLSVTVLYQIAELFEAEKRPQLALETYQEVISRFGRADLVEAAYLRRGEIFAGQGHWSVALTEYQHALANAKSDSVKEDALYGIAKAHQELKRYEPAAETYRRVVTEFPAGRFVTASLRGIAHTLTQAGRKAEARQAWQELIERAPKEATAAEAHLELGLLLQSEGDHRKAIQQFAKGAAQGAPEMAARAQYEIGRSYTLLKDYQQGALELLKVAYLYPQQTRWVQRALFQAAANYEQEQQWEEALAIYQKIVKEAGAPEPREQASQKIEQLKKKRDSGA